MKIEKIKTYLGFAVKSGNIIFGSDKLFESKKRSFLVLICSTQNEKVTNKVVNFCKKDNIKFIKLKDIILAELLGRDNCKVVGISDFNLANAITNEFQMEN